MFKDRALALPPLDRTLAHRLMERTQIYSALKEGFRGPIDVATLEELLVRFSRWFGSELLKLLVKIGRKERLRRIIGRISPENTTMKTVREQVDFKLHFGSKVGEFLAEMDLSNRRA